MKKESILKYLEYFLLIPSFILLGVLILFYSINSLIRIPFLYIQVNSWKRAWSLYKDHLVYITEGLIGSA